MSSLQQGAWYK